MHAVFRVVSLTIAVLAFASAAQAAPPPEGSKWSQHFIDEADGTQLYADVLRPANVPDDQPTPVILSIGPYFNHSGQTGVLGPVEDVPFNPLTTDGPSDRFYDFIEGAKVFERGYTWVQVDLRGFGGSSGCLDWAGPGEQADVKAAVEWAASQPWSTGKVGMYGKSYDGVTGLLGIKQQPKGLSAVISQEPVYDLYRYLYMNRVRYLNSLATPMLYNAIAGTPGTAEDSLAYNQNSINDTSRPGCPAFNYADQQDSNHGSDYWKSRDLIEGVRGKTTPLFLTQGLLENNTKPDGAAALFNAVKGPKRAWLGMWDHVRGNDKNEDGRLAMGRTGWFDEAMRFYDLHLKGKSATEKDPRVVVETNDGKWRSERNWPPSDAFTADAQLAPGEYTDDGQNNGSGDGGTPPYGLGVWTFSQAFPHTVRLSGTPRLSVDTDESPGSNLFVDVYDVGPDNKATLLTRGAYKLEGPERVSFDLYDQDWVFERGHRIGVLVTGGQAEWWLEPPTGRSVTVESAELQLPFLACRRSNDLSGSRSIRLDDYMEDAPFELEKETIEQNTYGNFPIPGPLADCSKRLALRRCIDRRKFRFTIDQPRGGRIKKVAVFVNGKRRKVKRGRRVEQVTIRRLPKRTFTVKIVATSNEGQKTISVRRYRGCKKSKPRTRVRNQHPHGR